MCLWPPTAMLMMVLMAALGDAYCEAHRHVDAASVDGHVDTASPFGQFRASSEVASSESLAAKALVEMDIDVVGVLAAQSSFRKDQTCSRTSNGSDSGF